VPFAAQIGDKRASDEAASSSDSDQLVFAHG
jgi:hypothetical protein